MAIEQTAESSFRKPLRLWPGVVAVVLQWLAWLVVPLIMPGTMGGIIGAFGGLVGGLLVLVWWAFFSRAPWRERWGAILLMTVALVATSRILHETLATGGMGMLFYMYAIPVLSLAFVVWAAASRRLSDGRRQAAMIVTILVASGAWTLTRTNGVTGDGNQDFAWRWAETPEERLLARAGDEPTLLSSAPVAAEAGAGWPGFRGPHRDGIIPGVRLEIDWSVSPPVELWRRPIGPGWSSFAVGGNLLYTQEQRGDDEVVACYDATTGEAVWKHRDAVRFQETMGGVGPRATPTLSHGRVYTLGATGILNVLDAADGTIVWSRNAASDTGAEIPYWGFASSPLVIEDLVIVAAAGALVAYDLITGDPRWFGPVGGEGYSSPHLSTIDGVEQILLLSEAGATSVAPADGALLWEHTWPGFSIVQPALIADGDVLVGSDVIGTRRIGVAHGPGGWSTEERWTSVRLRPYFNDFVVHLGHAFGFDGGILACIDVEDGERKWKGGRYGHGQLVLLPDQDLLLVLSEKGELALVAAVPDQFTELARFPAMEGKTWNHPVLAGDVLLIRNGQEMAAFRLSLAGG
jgi:outer membrane protein assembly factor BamB